MVGRADFKKINTMKRRALIIAILWGMTLGAFAQFGNREGDVTYAPIVLPPHGFLDDQEASTGAVTQTIALSEGANYVSFYVNVTLSDLKSALVAALPGTEITIRSQTQNASYKNGRWTGQLKNLDLAKMYIITVDNACEISLAAIPLDSATLTVAIENGANYMAFPYNASMTVTNFFAGFAVNNDVVRSQTQNSTYRNGRWTGQLKDLEPGQGYIYKSAATDLRTFTFPTSAKQR